MTDIEIDRLFSRLSVKLIFNQLKLVTVESCTGGLISKFATDNSGSSEWFEGAIVTYSNEAKFKLVGVSPELIEKKGAVSEEVASAMCSGATKIFPNCLSIAVTGIAGPGGGSDEKPVGTVCIACKNGESIKVRKYQFDGDRASIRMQTVFEALSLALTMKFK